MDFRRRICLVALLAALAPTQAARGEYHALLVGCTRYVHLANRFQLEGPSNDVALFREVLIKRFGVAPERITILTETGGKARPTRANIVAAFEDLIRRVRPGDQVVVFLAGHGTRQPADLSDPEYDKPDGLAEVFCPSDIEDLEHNREGKIVNGIADREFRQWRRALTDKGARVWITIDACHSGTMTRGNSLEIVRGIPPQELLPDSVLREARQKAMESRKRPQAASLRQASDDRSPARGDWTALYACQADEVTVERPLPRESEDAQYHGLLTFALAKILTESSGAITYRELAERIHAQYLQWGGMLPTPLLEGSNRDLAVLGAEELARKLPIRLTRDALGRARIDAGAIHGLSLGSILVVYPADREQKPENRIGHVRITQLHATDAEVEPCAYQGMPVPRELPRLGRCEMVYVGYGLHGLRVAADDRQENGEPLPAVDAERLRGLVRRLAAEPTSPVQAVDRAADADWLLRLRAGRVILAPATTRAGSSGDATPATFGPYPLDDHLVAALQVPLGRIARAGSLLRIATASQGERPRGNVSVAVDTELIRYRDPDSSEGEVVRWQEHGIVLHPGETVAFRIHNRGRVAVDVTLLFVDSGYGISPVFPQPGLAENRIPPGKTVTTQRGTVTSTTTGQEEMVVISVQAPAQQEPADFSFLAQETLPQTRGPAQRAVLDSPLGQLLASALFSQDDEGNRRRGYQVTEIGQHAFEVVSWRVVPAGEKHSPKRSDRDPGSLPE